MIFQPLTAQDGPQLADLGAAMAFAPAPQVLGETLSAALAQGVRALPVFLGHHGPNHFVHMAGNAEQRALRAQAHGRLARRLGGKLLLQALPAPFLGSLHAPSITQPASIRACCQHRGARARARPSSTLPRGRRRPPAGAPLPIVKRSLSLGNARSPVTFIWHTSLVCFLPNGNETEKAACPQTHARKQRGRKE